MKCNKIWVSSRDLRFPAIAPNHFNDEHLKEDKGESLQQCYAAVHALQVMNLAGWWFQLLVYAKLGSWFSNIIITINIIGIATN